MKELEKIEKLLKNIEAKSERVEEGYERALIEDLVKRSQVIVGRMKRKDRLTVVK